ncbi:MAG TPA: hypothetical protein VD706_03055 [Candidatus Saccharimonadales bacterium]|nr:hypothetical protein [Candidatus Saccharimonadales bacterium]
MLEQLKLKIQQAEPAIDMPVKIVAIDGHGGAGKTVFAERLAQLLDAEVLHTDDFATWDNPLDWWDTMVDKVLDPLKAGAQKLSYSRSSWYKNHQPASVVDQPVTPIMIIEGVSSSRKEFRPYLAYSIWIETPKEICLKRGISRDLADIDKSEKEIEQKWNEWHQYEEEYVKRDDPRGYADIIVDGTRD